jgi:hypothetical protein
MSGYSRNLCPHIGAIAHLILGEPNRELSIRQQLRYANGGTLAIEIAEPRRGKWCDHQAAVGGGPWELLKEKLGLNDGEIIEWLDRELGLKRHSPRPSGKAKPRQDGTSGSRSWPATDVPVSAKIDHAKSKTRRTWFSELIDLPNANSGPSLFGGRR